MSDDCEFCDIEAFRSFGSPVYIENELCLFGNSDDGEGLRGSGIVVPKAHRQTVFDLTPAEVIATFELLNEAKRRLDVRYAPDGYTVGWASGSAAGQKVLHAHLHVVPRYADEPYAGRGFRWWLQQDETRRPGN